MMNQPLLMSSGQICETFLPWILRSLICLSGVAFWKHNALGRFIKFGQKFLNQTCLHASRLFWMDEVTHDYIEPGICVYAKQHGWLFANFKLIDGRLRQQLAIDANLTFHRFADFVRRNALHRLGPKSQIAVVSDAELYLVPNVGKDRPRIVVDSRI